MKDVIAALRRRAEKGQALDLRPETRTFWRGYARSLTDLESGLGQFLADKDALLDQAHLSQSSTGTCTSALSVGTEGRASSDDAKVFVTKGIQRTGDFVAKLDISLLKQLEDEAVAAALSHQDHSVSRIDCNNGAHSHQGSPAKYRKVKPTIAFVASTAVGFIAVASLIVLTKRGQK